jgi:hypothetical protein
MKKILFAFALVVAISAISCTGGSTTETTVSGDSTSVKSDTCVSCDTTKTVEAVKAVDSTKK